MKLIFYGLLIIYGFREIHISIESTECYKLWISHFLYYSADVAYIWWNLATFYQELSSFTGISWKFQNPGVYFHFWSRRCWWKLLPSLPHEHITHSSEQHQCQNVSLEEIKLGQVNVTYLCVHTGSLSRFSECDLNLAVSVQNLKRVSLSHYLWLWRETSCSVHVPRRCETQKEGEWRTAGEAQMWRKKLSPSDWWLWSKNILTPMGAQLSAKALRKRSKTYPCPWGVFSLVETDITLFHFPCIMRDLLNSLFCHTWHFPAEDANFQGKYFLILFCWSCEASYSII